MAPSRPGYHLDLNNLPPLISPHNRSNSSTATSSPVEGSAPAGARLAHADTIPSQSATSRTGTGSPSHEYGSRFYPSRRTRELASEGGSSRAMWGPPVASGLSTPLRETIPESPGDDGADTFPDFGPSASDPALPMRSASLRRSRAGTMPSKTAPGSSSGQAPTSTLSSRPTPSTSPFRPASSALGGLGRSNSSSSTLGQSTLLSRIRAGSMPHRSALLTTNSTASSPFGSGIFSTNYKPPRERASTHTGAQEPTSPSQSGFWETNFADTDIKTLDYLGLADRPPQSRSSRTDTLDSHRPTPHQSALNPLIANLGSLNRSVNRYRSYSVNAKEKYAAEEDSDLDSINYYSGTLTPSSDNIPASLRNQILQHNLEVQAFANRASSSRPRARTAGVLDSPSAQNWQNFSSMNARYASALSLEMAQAAANQGDYGALADALQAMNLQGTDLSTRLDQDLAEGDATRSLWLGGVPKSVAESSLRALFEKYGAVISTKVLPEKNCAFVNFESETSAMIAKRELHGKEIFPGSGPIRIGYAKSKNSAEAMNASVAGPSSSPDPFTSTGSNGFGGPAPGLGGNRQASATADLETMRTPSLSEMQGDILNIVGELGATISEQDEISSYIDKALSHDTHLADIPGIPDPSPHRIHDAPKLREIRKRIDSGACPASEVEAMAIAMLPEIAELASDYLGNTVVQKLFEHCSESVKEAMLEQIAPHLAEIGVHKNGTWAAQKIIDLARTPKQMSMIVENIRSYGMACFLDQYGNYVMQGCLKFGLPFNSFIFEAMLSRLWEVSQGRFGARAMRACLESHYATKDQQRMLAAAIALHGVQLASNANGALLLTWLLDTCNFSNRRRVLAPRLIPHLVQLCTHKVAYLTVLKIINQKNEPEARDDILNALFMSPNDITLTEILKDHTCGATFIFKVITTPFLEDNVRPVVQENIRKVLHAINATPQQGYKRLMDEVGLPTRSNGVTSQAKRGPNMQPEMFATGYGNAPSASATPQKYMNGTAQQVQAPMFDRFMSPAQAPQYNPSAYTSEAAMLNNGGAGMPAIPPGMYAMSSPFQQPIYTAPASRGQPSGMAPQPAPGFGYPPNPMTVGGYPTPSTASVDPYRQMPGRMSGQYSLGTGAGPMNGGYGVGSGPAGWGYSGVNGSQGYTGQGGGTGGRRARGDRY